MKYDREIGERALHFSVAIIKITKQLKTKGVDAPIINQILRSGTSIGANIIEGKASSTKKELTRYYDIALRSANETVYWFSLIYLGYEFDSELVKNSRAELNEIRKILGAITLKLKQIKQEQ